MIQSRKSEERYITSDPYKMLNKYLVGRLCRKWTETFVDEATNEPGDVERSELILEKGTLITQENLATIRFYMSEGSISEVEVSNQRRQSFEAKNEVFSPYMAQVEINAKKIKMFFYARSVENAVVILKDYIELNYEGMFDIIMVKQFDSCIILLDTLKPKQFDADAAYMRDEITTEQYLEEISRQYNEEENEKLIEMKWYKINSRIVLCDKDGDESEHYQMFVVKAVSAERANMLINVYLKKKQDADAADCERRGGVYEKKMITANIEESAIMPIGCFIPKEFSEVYKD